MGQFNWDFLVKLIYKRQNLGFIVEILEIGSELKSQLAHELDDYLRFYGIYKII